MKIAGIQKLTLLDYPGKVACTIFTSGCNFRCPFCHNASLVLPELLNDTISTEEVLSFLKKRQGILDGICLTGGEPLINNDVFEFLTKIKDMGYFIKLDTNGSFPKKLKTLVSSGVIDYVAMDIKNSKDKYMVTSGVNDLDISSIKESIDFLISGKIEYEFRTTVVREFHDENSFKGISKLIKGADKYFIQCYKESDNMIGSGLSAYDENMLNLFADIVRPYVKTVSLRGI